MITTDGNYICDLCGKDTTGEFSTITGNHTACEELAQLRAVVKAAREVMENRKIFKYPPLEDLAAALEGVTK